MQAILTRPGRREHDGCWRGRYGCGWCPCGQWVGAPGTGVGGMWICCVGMGGIGNRGYGERRCGGRGQGQRGHRLYVGVGSVQGVYCVSVRGVDMVVVGVDICNSDAGNIGNVCVGSMGVGGVGGVGVGRICVCASYVWAAVDPGGCLSLGPRRGPLQQRSYLLVVGRQSRPGRQGESRSCQCFGQW